MLILCLILPGNAINHKEFDHHFSFSFLTYTATMEQFFIYSITYLTMFRVIFFLSLLNAVPDICNFLKRIKEYVSDSLYCLIIV